MLTFISLPLKYLCFLYNICTLQIFIDFLVFPQSLAKSCIFSTFNLLDSFHKSVPTLLVSLQFLRLFDLCLWFISVQICTHLFHCKCYYYCKHVSESLSFSSNIKASPGLFLKNFITDLDLLNHFILSRPSAAAAKSLQLCLTLCDPVDGSPPGSAIPGTLQARTLEWVAISFSNAWKWKVKSESEVAQSCPTPSDPMDCSPPGSSVHGTFQATVRSGVPLPSRI